jgi:hypothetical protein
MKRGQLQAKDIPDEPILAFLAGPSDGWPVCGWATSFPGFPNSVQNAMPPGVPEKLARAKMASLIRRGLVHGCACGCRGDYRIDQ